MRPALVAACHTVAMGNRLANARRPSSPAWACAGTAPLVSDGMSGSYLEAATNAAARVVFPGGGVGPFTFSAWISPESSDALIFGVSVDDTQTLLVRTLFDSAPHDSVSAYLISPSNDAASPTAFGGVGSPSHIAIVSDGVDILLYLDGALADSQPLPVDTYAAKDACRLFAGGPADPLAGSIRSPAVYSAALDVSGIGDIYAGGVDFDLSSLATKPAHWWPALGDTLPTIVDRGLVGGCNLTASGGISIGSV